MKKVTSCRACGRLLKTPVAIAAGIGPVCFRREEGQQKKGRQFRGKLWDQPGLFDGPAVEVEP